jgi:RNA polymerase primary sigma factor
LKDIRQYEILTKEEELKLLIAAKNGCEESKEKLILSNLRLVVNVAKKYTKKGLSLIDLISEGNFGLIHAIKKFDIDKGFRFSTYAVWWIKQSITKSIISKGREIRIPSYKYDMLNKINKFIMNHMMETSKYPDFKEISKGLGIPEDKVQKVVLEFQDLMSLNASIGEDIFLEDTICQPEEQSLENQVLNNIGREEITKMLDALKPREKEIVKLRYGIDGYDIHTLEEIGQTFNITRERVRQIEKKTLMKLRTRFSDELRPYLLK